MTDAALAGFGVVRTPGLTPAANNTVVANISGGTAYPTNVPISSIPFEAADITVGTTTVTNGTTTRILYNNVGVLGEYTISGTGTVVAMATSPTFTTPVLGAATATSLAIGGATLSGNALAITGAVNVSGSLSTASNYLVTSNTSGLLLGASGDVFINRAAAANLRLGTVAVDTAPIAQTLSVQNTLAGGTSNVAGANFTIAGSQGKGTGAGGSLIFQTAPAGSTGTTVNALATVLTLFSTGAATFTGAVTANGQLSATGILNANASFIFWGTRAALSSSADGILRVSPNAGSTGAAVDVNTNDTWKFRNFANSADAAISAAAATFSGNVNLRTTTVSGLGSAATVGATAFVTDASTTVILGLGLTVVGGGANKVPVYADGTNWIIG